MNNKFFESIFGSNTIDITPQGSIGVDLGYRYQRSDNPVASVINRRSPGFDFDQRISLSLLGKIGEGEIFGERGPSLDESRSVTAEAATNVILYPISEQTLKEKK